MQQATLEEQAAVLDMVRGAPHVLEVHRHELDSMTEEAPGGTKRGGVLRVVTECAPAAAGSSSSCGRRLHLPVTCRVSVAGR